MTPAELRATIADLGLAQVGFARIAGVNPATVRQFHCAFALSLARSLRKIACMCNFPVDMAARWAYVALTGKGNQARPARKGDTQMSPTFLEIESVDVKKGSDGRLYAKVIGIADYGFRMSAEYRTDRDGWGLWEWDPKRVDWKQIIGTGQYRARSRAELRRELPKILMPWLQ